MFMKLPILVVVFWFALSAAHAGDILNIHAPIIYGSESGQNSSSALSDWFGFPVKTQEQQLNADGSATGISGPVSPVVESEVREILERFSIPIMLILVLLSGAGLGWLVSSMFKQRSPAYDDDEGDYLDKPDDLARHLQVRAKTRYEQDELLEAAGIDELDDEIEPLERDFAEFSDTLIKPPSVDDAPAPAEPMPELSMSRINAETPVAAEISTTSSESTDLTLQTQQVGEMLTQFQLLRDSLTDLVGELKLTRTSLQQTVIPAIGVDGATQSDARKMMFSRSTEEAVVWMDRAGQASDAQAFFDIAQYYSNANPSPENVKKALVYADRAMLCGHPQAMTLRNQVDKKLTELGPIEAVDAIDVEEPADSNTAEAAVDSMLDSTEDALSAIEETANSIAATKTASESDKLLKTGNWLLEQEPDTYTVQLTDSLDSDEIREYVAMHQLGDDAVYYATQRGAGKTYVLIHGRYDSIKQAQAFAAQFSQDAGDVKPWVRKFKHLWRTYSDPS